MTDNEVKIQERRIQTVLKRIKTLFYEKKIPLQASYCKYKPIVAFDQRLHGKFNTIQVGESWGRNWEMAWFHIEGEVPYDWIGKCIAARINLGGEALLFDKNGNPKYALSCHTIWPDLDFGRDRITISNKASGGEKIDWWLEATAGELFGLQLHQDQGLSAPESFGSHNATIKDLSLAVFRQDIWHLYIDFLVLFNLMKSLPNESVRRAKIRYVLNKAADSFLATDEQTVNKTRKILQPELNKKCSASDLTAYAIGHAHLDTAWLWRIDETIRKCARTFSTQIALLDIYPDYIFGASQAQHYDYVKTEYPALYQKIKDKVAAGKWEILGGMWVEADCTIISGESLLRQILLGKNFFRDEFGVDVRFLWLPDVFGYNAAMPQILNKSGLDFFVTQKISWSQYNTFPHHTFLWRGIDGSEVITHFPPEDDYNSQLNPAKLNYAQENFIEKDFLDEFLTIFGVGDGGGGPTEEIIESGLRQQDLEGTPKIRFAKVQDFFDRLQKKKKWLPTWVGELYLELHRGTLTTHATIKKLNRFMEFKLRELEILYSLLPYNFYPSQQLDQIWKKVLLQQFHDIIPGSSVTPVYEDCRKDYKEMIEETKKLHQRFGDLALKENKDTICLINTLTFAYSRPIELPESWQQFSVIDDKGNTVPKQIEDTKPIILPHIPPLGVVTLKKAEPIEQDIPQRRTNGFTLENELIRYSFSNQGAIVEAFDKEDKMAIITEDQPGNIFCLYEDRPMDWDAWDIDIFYENQFIEQGNLESQTYSCFGPVRTGIRHCLRIGNSKIIQNIYLTPHSKRLDFVTEIEWTETHKMLRVSFPVKIKSDTATYEIQYGNIKRSTHRNTSWERAKFEVAAFRYVDLSDENYGVALLNDCKYGHKIVENRIDLNLLRATTSPDPKADRGIHHVSYSLLPHHTDLIHSSVLEEAVQLNQPPALFFGFNGTELKFPFALDTNKVVLEVIKKAEKEQATIFRLYEPMGKRVTANLQMDRKPKFIFETDLMEHNSKQYHIKHGNLFLQFEPYEIKTIKVIWKT